MSRVVELFRIVGTFNGEKVLGTSNVASEETAKRIMEDVAVLYPELQNLHIESYKEFQF